MKIEFDDKEVRALHLELRNVTPQAAQWAFNQAAHTTQSHMKKLIQHGPATGTTYYRVPGNKYMTVRAGSIDGPPVAFIPGGGKHGKSLTHQASAPGEPPMSDTGDLARHLTTDQQHPKNIKHIRQARAAAGAPDRFEYADHLEFKPTDKGGRPFAHPAFLKAFPSLLRDVKTAMKRALR